MCSNLPFLVLTPSLKQAVSRSRDDISSHDLHRTCFKLGVRTKNGKFEHKCIQILDRIYRPSIHGKCLNGYLSYRHVPFYMDIIVVEDATIFHSLICPTFCEQYMM